MKLNSLFENAPEIEIQGLMSDSRKKRPNSIFFCVKGMMNDGHRFISQAIKNGAVCIVYSDPIAEMNPAVTYVRVKDVVIVYNQIADIYYNRPSKKMVVFGVTGTNGKSSVTTLIKNLLNTKVPTGYIGTISIEYGSVKLPPLLTTPEIDDLHGVLHDMVEAGMKACTLEVSSIGIEQHRIDSIRFDVGIFTNLTHDHLDYHGTMENYFAAKKAFFDRLPQGAVAITNVDDAHGKQIVEDCQCTVFTYGINEKADFQAVDIQLLPDRSIFTLKFNEQNYRVETNMVALFNIYNLLAAIAALYAKGIPLESILPLVKTLNQVEGRMERIDMGQPFNVVVDFAHTPDGIKQVMEYASRITEKENRIIAVFGSAGKRDFKKRPVFGEIADKYCDMIILTEDDPRDENVYDIASDIAEGIQKTNYIIIEQRADAIRQAIEMANTGDTILVLGKGNEIFMYREFGREPYQGDHRLAREMIEKYYYFEGEENELEIEQDY